jgi:hypothetical protein
MTSCINCGNPHVENKDTGLCATCGALERKAARLKMPADSEPIKRVSDNQSKLLAKYNAKRKSWIRGKKCAVFPSQNATQVHHMLGRVGYADEWARENDVPLLLDERFWLPVSDEGHKKITENPVWAWENQYSFKRITDPIFRKDVSHQSK